MWSFYWKPSRNCKLCYLYMTFHKCESIFRLTPRGITQIDTTKTFIKRRLSVNAAHNFVCLFCFVLSMYPTRNLTKLFDGTATETLIYFKKSRKHLNCNPHIALLAILKIHLCRLLKFWFSPMKSSRRSSYTEKVETQYFFEMLIATTIASFVEFVDW